MAWMTIMQNIFPSVWSHCVLISHWSFVRAFSSEEVKPEILKVLLILRPTLEILETEWIG